jgi:serine/threonine-protein kinase RsbW
VSRPDAGYWVGVDECTDLLSLQVPCAPEAPSIARGALTEVLRDEWSLQDILLVVSELVSNAVQHSGGQSSDSLHVLVTSESDRLTISVLDPGRSGRGAVSAVDEGRTAGGWGLQIVEQLARRWGTERPDGYRVWAELARP